jgi:protein-tyrosine phosphatase
LIDIHHHCLPGVDDGPGTMEEALAQCRAAAADGIRTVVATPHRRHPRYDAPPGTARAAHGTLVAALAREGIALELLLGHEAHYAPELAADLKAGSTFRLGGNGRWFLFELPDTHVPAHLDRLVFDLHLAGQFPILAHPERNLELSDHPERLEPLRRQGVAVQVTAMSVTGDFGRKARRAAERWLRDGLVDLLATDAHGTGKRPPRLRAAVDAAAKILGKDAAERLVTGNPARVLRGEALS